MKEAGRRRPARSIVSAAVIIVQRPGVHLPVVRIDHIVGDAGTVLEEALDNALHEFIVVLTQFRDHLVEFFSRPERSEVFR